MKRQPKRKARARSSALVRGEAVIYPRGVEKRFGISAVTRWRWERRGKMPPRDVHLLKGAIGWRPATIEAAESAEPAT
jgi:predicted DNA-binding transcriptional regulator AlpA